MRSLTFLSILPVIATVRADLVADLFNRDINPQDDPVRFSVLSVLHTALPSDLNNIPLPTPGVAPPQWYQDLPEDVKGLLPSLYPVTTTSAAVAIPTVISATLTFESPQATQATQAPSQATQSIQLPKGTAVYPTGVTGGNSTGNGTQPTGLPTPSEFTGAAARLDVIAAAMWVGVGTALSMFV